MLPVEFEVSTSDSGRAWSSSAKKSSPSISSGLKLLVNNEPPSELAPFAESLLEEANNESLLLEAALDSSKVASSAPNNRLELPEESILLLLLSSELNSIISTPLIFNNFIIKQRIFICNEDVQCVTKKQ